MILRHESSYQGYSGKACQYRRSPGLQAEYGWIDLDFEQVKQIKMVSREIPWRGIRGFEIDGQTDIRTFFLTASRATVTIPIELTAPRGGGFNQFGDLVLKTFNHVTGGLKQEVRFKDVFVDSTGLEEITSDLADIESHSTGTIRVPLSDIRRYYPRYGAFFGRVNYRLRSGSWDPTSVKDGRNKAYTLQEVLVWLFSQLPGSPSIVSWSELFSGTFDPPALPEGEGEPTVEILHKVLERNGLVPMMQLDNSFAVHRKNSRKFGHQQVPRARGRVSSGGQRLQLHYERKSVTTTDRPPAVLVVGKKRIKRITLPYIAVLQDTNGGWYTIAEIAKRWEFGIDRINKGAPTGQEKNFSDVPPRPPEQVDSKQGSEEIVETGGGLLHYKRKQILKQAYKFYAPAHLFQKQKDIKNAVTGRAQKAGRVNRGSDFASVSGAGGGGGAPTASGGGEVPEGRGLVGLAEFGGLEGFGDADFTNTSFLPMTECPWYVSELENIGISIPKDIPGKGDREDYVLMPPVVRAQRMGQQFFSDFSRVRESFDAITEQTKLQLDETRALRTELDARTREFAVDIRRSELVFTTSFSSSEARQKYLDTFGLSEVDVGKDVQRAARFVGVQINSVIKERMSDQSWSTLHSIVDMVKAISDLDEKAEKLDEKLTQWESQFQIFKNNHQKHRGFKLWYNLPQMVLDDGIARIDPATGILKSTEKLMHVDKPIFFDGDEARVIDDGQVIVTFAYELQDPNINAWTTFLFVPSDTADDQPARPILAGVSRSTPIKAFVQPYNGRMYLMDAGTPVNLNEVYTEAKQKAASILGIPRLLTGFTYEYSGFHKFPLDAGISGVQWIWDGNIARTHLSINAPNARMPLGPNRLADMEPRRGPSPTPGIDTRDQLEREAE